MIALTRLEKSALVLMAVVIFVGGICLLIEKRSPVIWQRFVDSWEGAVFVRVNVNTADVEEWKSLPGIGDYRAAQIVAFRESHGPFRSIEEVRYVKGIGPRVFGEIEKFLYVDHEKNRP